MQKTTLLGRGCSYIPPVQWKHPGKTVTLVQYLHEHWEELLAKRRSGASYTSLAEELRAQGFAAQENEVREFLFPLEYPHTRQRSSGL